MASAANILDIEYVRLRAPDLDVMQTFLIDFGMQVAARTPQRLYMRGTERCEIHPYYRAFGYRPAWLQSGSALPIPMIWPRSPNCQGQALSKKSLNQGAAGGSL